ncbi:hypothetical protein J6590_039915, partial [Homalodisca vitripennis]
MESKSWRHPTVHQCIQERNTLGSQRNNHRNVSELLDNLLRGYDNSVRPGLG